MALMDVSTTTNYFAGNQLFFGILIGWMELFIFFLVVGFPIYLILPWLVSIIKGLWNQTALRK